MALLIALINIVGWGLIPLTVKGSPASQIAGMGIGASASALVIYLFTRPAFDTATWVVAFIAGMLWAIGQMGQFISFTRIGVSGTIPLSAGFQLVGNSLIGVLIFGEWPTTIAKIIGFVALALVVIGIVLSSRSDDKESGDANAKNIAFLLVTTIGFWIYSSFPKLIAKDINPNVNGLDYILPEMLGVLVGTMIYVVGSHQTKVYQNKMLWRNSIAGIEFGVGTLFYLFSVQQNGVTDAFIYSQLCSVISTFGGIWFLHESKSKREMIYIVVGLIFIVGGSILTGFAK
ncbi:GRP family sugar transporter [Lactobacillus ultunensis]|uniref:Sugar transport protein n=1 Tax=Lactobacillus ultunensis DSM 16047 TaxID=525365 RepID=C2EKF7_9LACO|nr:GRP family sugar transporter [Lactobacillus ultunensis]EEJ72983.1 sugar transport protein [Lactobacillus ultunensis DSM 16047]KRL80285.1 DMT superfamily drug metabolite transporter [Lactobacillus ultunensis DSM 16047]QQP29312.1 hypothetical protein H4B44_04470 [Lactobacillus ultunensis]